MNQMLIFALESILLGVGLAMDAFSVSVANGLQDPRMRRKRAWIIAGAFAFFQFLMPVIGWFCVHTIAEHFALFRRAVPWIAFVLLGVLGTKMILEGSGDGAPGAEAVRLTAGELLAQGIATSIDALSVGFTIASYRAAEALAASFLIGLTTFVICLAGIRVGKVFGMRLAGRATVFGGIILIAIGCKILFGGGF
ncbi:MAG: manganese efflux pump MntP family protein [Eubacteriales bacterium]|nr:manganese efflux pump MntP family protein [Eubacteriales bacterium]